MKRLTLLLIVLMNLSLTAHADLVAPCALEAKLCTASKTRLLWAYSVNMGALLYHCSSGAAGIALNGTMESFPMVSYFGNLQADIFYKDAYRELSYETQHDFTQSYRNGWGGLVSTVIGTPLAVGFLKLFNALPPDMTVPQALGTGFRGMAESSYEPTRATFVAHFGAQGSCTQGLDRAYAISKLLEK